MSNIVTTVVIPSIAAIASWIGTFLVWRSKRNFEAKRTKEESLRNKAVDSSLRRDELLFQKRADAAAMLWRAVVAQDRYVGALNVLSFLKFDGLSKCAMINSSLRELLAKVVPNPEEAMSFNTTSEALSAESTRLFIPDVAYQMYECRMKLIMLPAVCLKAMQSGIDARQLGDDESIINELCGFLPDIADRIRELKQQVYSTAFDILKVVILQNLQHDLLSETVTYQVVNIASLFERRFRENQKNVVP